MRLIASFIFLLTVYYGYAQEKEKIQSPPMGWNSWNYFGKQNINEHLIIEVIDAIVEEGLDKAGYEYIVIDGGWRDSVLGPGGELRAHPQKFPRGMKFLADYAHARGLKFGLHTTPGSHDCGCDKVGGWGKEAIHVKQFEEWGVDFVKLDRCRFRLDDQPIFKRNDKRWFEGWDEEGENIKHAYTTWSELLKKSIRPIVLSASAYRFYEWYPSLSQMGRTTGDIASYQSGGAAFDNGKKNSVMSIAEKNDRFFQHAGKGYWNDPDMLVTGGQGLTIEEEKAHFALWCIMSAPLMLGNDPRKISIAEKNIITNKLAIDINQDATEQGRRIKAEKNKEIWAKRLSDNTYAVLLLNRDATHSEEITLLWKDISISGSRFVQSVYDGKEIGIFNDRFVATVGPHESVFLILKNK